MEILIFDHMEQATEAEIQRMLPLVSTQRREQAMRYKHVFGQFCCLKSWLMLKQLLDNGQWTMDNWSYNEYGKPFFTPSLLHSFTPYFSISHCKEGIAVAIDDKPIGIDIEGIRHADEELIARTMNEEERLQVTGYGLPDRMFTRLWTQKEAIVKAEGVGIMSFEQLQKTLVESLKFKVESVEKEKYIYSVAYQL